jgi:hypothetical protein
VKNSGQATEARAYEILMTALRKRLSDAEIEASAPRGRRFQKIRRWLKRSPCERRSGRRKAYVAREWHAPTLTREVAMQFVVIADHSPDMCPTSNSKIRELMRQGAKEIPNLAAKLGVKIITLNVFGPDHRVLAVVEANDIQAVRDFVIESRLIQWNTTKVHATYTLEEALAMADKLPAMF